MSGILLVPSRGWRNAARIDFQTGGGVFGEAKRLCAEGNCFRHVTRCPVLSLTENYTNFDSRRMMSEWSQRITGHALAVRFIAVPSIWRSRAKSRALNAPSAIRRWKLGIRRGCQFIALLPGQCDCRTKNKVASVVGLFHFECRLLARSLLSAGMLPTRLLAPSDGGFEQ